MACCPAEFLRKSRLQSANPWRVFFFFFSVGYDIFLLFFKKETIYQPNYILQASLYFFPPISRGYRSYSAISIHRPGYPRSWGVLSETGDALNSIFPLYLDFFSFDFAEKEGLRLVWKRPFIKRDPREPKNDFPTPSLTLVCWSRWPE